MKTIRYRNIVEIEVGSKINQKIYTGLTSIAEFAFEKYADEGAKSFLKERSVFFSNGFIELLEKSGIDFEKDNEFVHYQLENNNVTEIWYDFIGEFNFLGDKKFDFYETSNFTVNIYFEENAVHGKRKEFYNAKTSRISFAIAKEK